MMNDKSKSSVCDMQMNLVCDNMLEGIVSPPHSPATVDISDICRAARHRGSRGSVIFIYPKHVPLPSSSTLCWQACLHHRITSHEHSHLIIRTTCSMQIFTEQTCFISYIPRKYKLGNRNNAYLFYLLYQDNREHLEHCVLHLNNHW